MALQNNPSATSMPSSETLVLALLSEELKSRRFFNTLAELGMDYAHYRPHLDTVILTLLGLNDERNETFDFYCRVMDEHAGKIGIKEDTVKEQAKEVYGKLVEYQKSQRASG
jgi:hypothetical protein